MLDQVQSCWGTRKGGQLGFNSRSCEFFLWILDILIIEMKYHGLPISDQIRFQCSTLCLSMVRQSPTITVLESSRPIKTENIHPASRFRNHSPNEGEESLKYEGTYSYLV